jgi:hypothetical protein
LSASGDSAAPAKISSGWERYASTEALGQVRVSRPVKSLTVNATPRTGAQPKLSYHPPELLRQLSNCSWCQQALGQARVQRHKHQAPNLVLAQIGTQLLEPNPEKTALHSTLNISNLKHHNNCPSLQLFRQLSNCAWCQQALGQARVQRDKHQAPLIRPRSQRSSCCSCWRRQ